MARPLSNGLAYFPFEVDLFSRKNIKRLRAKYGNNGIMVYIYLLCEIYRQGFAVDLDDDLILDISDELNISENSTRQILNYLLSRSMFDPKLAESVKVLTAPYIQLTYQEAIKSRAKKRNSDIDVDSRLWLLDNDETYEFIRLRFPDDSSQNYYRSSGNNSSLSSTNGSKESKVNKNNTKVNENNPAPLPQKNNSNLFGKYNHVSLTAQQYSDLSDEFGKSLVDDYIRKIDEWVQLNGKPYKDYCLAVKKWIGSDHLNASPSDKHSYDPDDYKLLVNNFD